MASPSPALILPEPPAELKRLSAPLCRRLGDSIAADGPMPFSRFMERALYEPGLGYYSAGLHKLGAKGDFVTAPELGHMFARCLAQQVTQLAAHLGAYQILELGAGTGALAADLLQALNEATLPERYLILEPSADLRRVQQQRLAEALPDLQDRIEWLDEPPTAPWTGILLANEVLDALPVERFRLAGGRVEQLCVTEADGGFSWTTQAAPPGLEQAVRQALGDRLDQLPDGFESEICPMLPAWLQAVTSSLSRGCALFVDYGYPRSVYYAAERRMGTLICHYRHRGHDDPFFYPGLQDISAFVDFTALAEAADAAGLQLAGYTSQAMFLLASGLEAQLAELASLPDRERLERAAEVRELTLPSAMGEKFQVMALSRDLDLDLHGFELLDLSHQL